MSAAYHHVQPVARGHVLRWVVVGVLVIAGVALLREATMNRPDPPRVEQTTTIHLSVRTNASKLALEDAASGLWAACASVVDRHALVALDQVGRQTFALRIEPALGHHAEARLVGCLEDVTVPRILGDVTRINHR